MGAVFATIEKSTLAFSNGQDIQIETARGEFVVRASNIAVKKLSKRVTLTIIPLPNPDVR